MGEIGVGVCVSVWMCESVCVSVDVCMCTWREAEQTKSFGKVHGHTKQATTLNSHL